VTSQLALCDQNSICTDLELNKRDAILNKMGYEGEDEKERDPLRQVTCPITICKQVQRVLLHTPEESGGMILAWDTKVTSPFR